jgi:predicted dehydrogenase
VFDWRPAIRSAILIDDTPGCEALLAAPAIGAVDNPLPNSLHAEWSKRAAGSRPRISGAAIVL